MCRWPARTGIRDSFEFWRKPMNLWIIMKTRFLSFGSAPSSWWFYVLLSVPLYFSDRTVCDHRPKHTSRHTLAYILIVLTPVAPSAQATTGGSNRFARHPGALLAAIPASSIAFITSATTQPGNADTGMDSQSQTFDWFFYRITCRAWHLLFQRSATQSILVLRMSRDWMGESIEYKRSQRSSRAGRRNDVAVI